MKDHIEIGQIYREHGLKGLCKVYIYSMSDDNLFEEEEYVLQTETGKTCKTKLLSIAVSKKFFLLQFDCFPGADAVIPWRKATLWIHKSKLQRDEGETFAFEWEGFQVFDANGKKLGEIQNVEYTPLPQFVVKPEEGENVLIPWVAEWIIKKDGDQKTVVLDLPEGLI